MKPFKHEENKPQLQLDTNAMPLQASYNPNNVMDYNNNNNLNGYINENVGQVYQQNPLPVSQFYNNDINNGELMVNQQQQQQQEVYASSPNIESIIAFKTYFLKCTIRNVGKILTIELT